MMKYKTTNIISYYDDMITLMCIGTCDYRDIIVRIRLFRTKSVVRVGCFDVDAFIPNSIV